MSKSNLNSWHIPYSVNTDWSEIVGLTDFSYPWEKLKAPAFMFKACHDSGWIHCRFEVMDCEAKVFVESNSKEEVLLGDRVEIFFRKDERMDPYYCLEMDSLGRVYDYRASFHRRFDPQWSWPEGHLKVEAHKINDGYTVLASISKASLEELGLFTSTELQVGLFRGQCNDTPGKMQWISWMRPESESADFHIPSAFGILRLGGSPVSATQL